MDSTNNWIQKEIQLAYIAPNDVLSPLADRLEVIIEVGKMKLKPTFLEVKR